MIATNTNLRLASIGPTVERALITPDQAMTPTS